MLDHFQLVECLKKCERVLYDVRCGRRPCRRYVYLVGVELADRRLSSHYFKLPLPLSERGLRLLRCKPPRHLEPPSRPPQGILSVVVVLGERRAAIGTKPKPRVFVTVDRRRGCARQNDIVPGFPGMGGTETRVEQGGRRTMQAREA